MDIETIRQEVRQLVGKPISLIQSGVGSIIYIGTADLFFTVYCSWRMRKNNQVLVNWHHELDAGDTIGTQLNALMGKNIRTIRINDLYDVFIELEDQYFLELFADITDNEYGRNIAENWDFVLISENRCYSVDYRLQVRIGTYSSSQRINKSDQEC
jgi:hypothetical protein